MVENRAIKYNIIVRNFEALWKKWNKFAVNK